MSFVELSKYLHDMRYVRSQRQVGAAMRVMEVWECALACPKNGIGQILYKETRLPRPFDGVFVRKRPPIGADLAVIYVHRPASRGDQLPNHWKEFAIIKELMHCWSPAETFVGTPMAAKELIDSLNAPVGRYIASAASDANAVVAAAEVILPHYVVDRYLAEGLDFTEIGHRQGIHPEVAEYICGHEMLHLRRTGSL